MMEHESMCNVSLEVPFIRLQFGSRLPSIMSKMDIISHN